MFIPIIMAGGSGSRQWPLLHQGKPKQFLPLVDAELTVASHYSALGWVGYGLAAADL